MWCICAVNRLLMVNFHEGEKFNEQNILEREKSLNTERRPDYRPTCRQFVCA